MKTIILLSILSFTQITVAGEGPLDGKKFCRSVETGGMFGQPRGTRLHCLLFNDGKVIDNANTFFGRPPEIFSYTINDTKIINADKNQDTSYELEDGNIVIQETGAVLVLQ